MTLEGKQVSMGIIHKYVKLLILPIFLSKITGLMDAEWSLVSRSAYF